MKAAPNHPVWSRIAPTDNAGGFRPDEFNFPYEMDAGFLDLLYKIRIYADVPFRIVSDHRPPERNEDAGGATKSAHMERPCRAVDLRVLSNTERFRIVQAALRHGIQRIGVYTPTADQAAAWGFGSGSIHLDASTENPQPRMWTR